MPIDITMPALSPTMETGTLAKWLVKVGDAVKSGDILAEIETDKATMELESIEEGWVSELLLSEGADAIPVGTVIARLRGEGEAEAPPSSPVPAEAATAPPRPAAETITPVGSVTTPPATLPMRERPLASVGHGDPVGDEAQPAATTVDRDARDRIDASPLARRLAAAANVDIASVAGSGPHGRVVKADVDAAAAKVAGASPNPAATAGLTPAHSAPREPMPPSATAPRDAAAPSALPAPTGVPMEAIKLSNMRRTIARRLTESKATVPHFYQTVDVRLDALLKLRGDLNTSLESTGVKLSVNDLLIKALGLALTQVPDANVQFAGTELYKFARADVSVAVAIPGGLITPIVVDAANKRLSVIATEMRDLAARAKDGKLKPEEYTGGTASISNLGMFGIKQFDAVINPPQGLILAVGAAEKRPYIVDDVLEVATVLSATGSFDHRAIDGAVGAQLMGSFKTLVENPLAMLV